MRLFDSRHGDAAYERFMEPQSAPGIYLIDAQKGDVCFDCGERKAVVRAAFEDRRGNLSKDIPLCWTCGRDRGIESPEV